MEFVTPQPKDDSGRIVGIVLVTIALTAVAAVVEFAFGLGISLGKCDGDGGSPYSAPASLAGRWCDGDLYEFWLLQLLLAPAIGLIVGVIAASRRSWKLLGIGAAITGALVALSLWPLTLSSSCGSGRDRDSAACQRY